MDGRVEKSDLRLFVEDDGTPVQALLRAVLRLTGSGANVKLDIDVTYRFSHVGEPVEIVAPEID